MKRQSYNPNFMQALASLSQKERELIKILGREGFSSEIDDLIFDIPWVIGSGKEEKAYELTRGARGMDYKTLASSLKIDYAPVSPLIMNLERRTHFVLRLSSFTSELFRDNGRKKSVVLTAKGKQAYRMINGNDLSSFDPSI